MRFLGNFKKISIFLTLGLSAVYCENILDKKCDYYCNITGKKYKGNTIYKNSEGLTLREHAKKFGDEYSYYVLCCDGKLTSREHVDVTKNNLEVLTDVNVNMKGSYTYMDSDKFCSTYCAINIQSRTAYLKESEDLTLTKFAKKYGKQYDLFTYCCDNKLDSDRMTLTSSLEEFSLNASYFTLDQSSKADVGKKITEEFVNDTCDYYCNIKDKSIISIVKNTSNLKISTYANIMKSSHGNEYDSFTKCCDGQMKARSNVPVINLNGSVELYQDLKSRYSYSYMDATRKCNFYCGFNDSDKSVSFINAPLSLIEAAKANQNQYDYFTYCCNKESDVKGNIVVVSPNGEEIAINAESYSIKGVNTSNKNDSTNDSKKTIKKTKTVTSTKSLPTSSNWKCGEGNGRCPDGYCCSKYNYCGKTNDHCSIASGCQTLYGKCN